MLGEDGLLGEDESSARVKMLRRHTAVRERANTAAQQELAAALERQASLKGELSRSRSVTAAAIAAHALEAGHFDQERIEHARSDDAPFDYAQYGAAVSPEQKALFRYARQLAAKDGELRLQSCATATCHAHCAHSAQADLLTSLPASRYARGELAAKDEELVAARETIAAQAAEIVELRRLLAAQRPPH